jgi:hypothetical protein
LVFVSQYKPKSSELVPSHCNPFFAFLTPAVPER